MIPADLNIKILFACLKLFAEFNSFTLNTQQSHFPPYVVFREKNIAEIFVYILESSSLNLFREPKYHDAYEVA